MAREPLRIACGECGKLFSRAPTITGRKPKYCSRVCVDSMLRKQKEALKDIPKDCIHCGKQFLTDKWKVNTKKYCSNKCSWVHNSKHGGTVEVPCYICGNIIKRNPSNVNKNNYCGHECMAKGKTLSAPRTNKYENVRTWFSRFNRMSECETCGYRQVPGILVLHHKDRNRENNQLENLAVLCPNCHAVEHLAERKSGWKGHKSNHPVKIKMRMLTQERKSGT